MQQSLFHGQRNPEKRRELASHYSDRLEALWPPPFKMCLRETVSQDLRQNLFLFVANEESSRSPQGLSSVTTLGLGSEGPRLNICFTWFYTPIIMGFTHPLCKGHQPCNALDLRLESASVEAKLAFLSPSLPLFYDYSVSNYFDRMIFFFSLTCFTFGQIGDLTNCPCCCLTYLTMYLINRRCSRLL